MADGNDAFVSGRNYLAALDSMVTTAIGKPVTEGMEMRHCSLDHVHGVVMASRRVDDLARIESVVQIRVRWLCGYRPKPELFIVPAGTGVLDGSAVSGQSYAVEYFHLYEERCFAKATSIGETK